MRRWTVELAFLALLQGCCHKVTYDGQSRWIAALTDATDRYHFDHGTWPQTATELEPYIAHAFDPELHLAELTGHLEGDRVSIRFETAPAPGECNGYVDSFSISITPQEHSSAHTP